MRGPQAGRAGEVAAAARLAVGSALFLLAACSHGASPTPSSDGTVLEARSLLGEDLLRPDLPDEVRQRYEAELRQAEARFAEAPEEVESHIWLGRRTAYLGRYREAIEIYSRALEHFPEEPRLYRHRGHRWLTLRQLGRAVADLSRAGELVAGQPDRVEPDGLPNAAGIPTSTLQSNIWYHLGLAHFLQGDLEAALESYRRDLAVSKNPDSLVATSNWLYLTLARLGREEEAAEVLRTIDGEMEILENHAYHRLLLLYRGDLSEEELLGGEAGLESATTAYGVGAWRWSQGRREEALALFRRIVETQPWAAFGTLAAEAELARR